jgi:hypothetical protein
VIGASFVSTLVVHSRLKLAADTEHYDANQQNPLISESFSHLLELVWWYVLVIQGSFIWLVLLRPSG